MPDLHLSLAMSPYDHVMDLLRGRVRAEGVTLTPIELSVEEIFFRMSTFQEWDAAEFAMGKYASLVAAGNPPFRAIPVFPSRMFRQSAIYVAHRAGIRDPRDLAGKRVGVPEWAQTAGIYVRGYLQHQCGMRPHDLRWVQAGVNESGRTEKARLSLPSGVELTAVPDRSLNEMLIAGDLDAIISAREPDAFVARDPRIRRLFPAYREVEAAYYRETGIFPIMHTVVVKVAVLDRHPWVAMNLLAAFEQAKVNSLNRLTSIVRPQLPIPWGDVLAAEVRETLGKDWWPYGLGANRRTLTAFLQFCHEQGVTSRRLNVEELFPKEVTAHFAV
ncbi:MAG: 4,5-dihydroxyphthalate decarboxylase [Acidobacteria bacterium]|nr:4,5-dihydroxyphthalate decarboxylase [Acidobacteriota bacterium]